MGRPGDTDAGITMIVLAVALVFNLPEMLQRAVPDYTVAFQKAMQNGIGADEIRHNLTPGATVNGQLADCDGADQLQHCGPAPAVSGITQWLNTPEGKPIDLASLRGKVVLIDFWAYSCINCQRAIPHLVDWYNRYRDDGLVVIGVHTPEYAFERVPGNVAIGAAALHITYPVALDNDYKTWNNYQNLYWPAEYLIDARGIVRHLKSGEGDYVAGETLIRQLLVDANPGVRLPAPVNGRGGHDSADQTHPGDLPEHRPGRKLWRRGRIQAGTRDV
jgi:thiol-disulfide isomerase/thioredoxin